jgi:hypothetical protein
VLFKMIVEPDTPEVIHRLASTVARIGQRYWPPWAFCYWNGIGCTVDKAKALRMLECSVRDGNRFANMWIANFLDNDGDHEQAKIYYQKALDDGYLLAELELPDIPAPLEIISFTCSPCHCTIRCAKTSFVFLSCPKCDRRIDRIIDCID